MSTLSPFPLRRVAISLGLGMVIAIAGGAFLASIGAEDFWFYALGVALVAPVVLQGLYAGEGLPRVRLGRVFAGAAMASSAAVLVPSRPTVAPHLKRRQRRAVERCLFVGGESSFVRLHDTLAQARQPAVLVGSVSLTAEAFGDEVLNKTTTTLHRLIADLEVHRLIIEFSRELPDEVLRSLVLEARSTGVQVSTLPRIVDLGGSSPQSGQVEGMASKPGVRRTLSRSSLIVKRTFDICVSVLLLLISAPLLAFIALLIKLETRGPVLFRDVRAGRNGKPFEMLKFRTMVHGAGGHRVDIEGGTDETSEQPFFLVGDDPRVTHVGRLLRALSLDELPQLFNVLKGEMTLVGPRPLTTDEELAITGGNRWRLQLTPGLTGPWQIFGSSRIPLAEMTTLDYLYVANWSLWTDVRILLRTLPIVLSGQPRRYSEYRGPQRQTPERPAQSAPAEDVTTVLVDRSEAAYRAKLASIAPDPGA